jgi:hypothetical protein
MDCEDDFNRFRYRTRVQAVAVIDIVRKKFFCLSLKHAYENRVVRMKAEL